jgi:hypothetical protein
MKYLFFLIAIIIITACTSSSENRLPSWYGQPSLTKNTLLGYGASANLQDAKLIALSDISFQLHSSIKAVLSKRTTVGEEVHSFSSLKLRNESSLVNFSMLKLARHENIAGQFYVIYEVSKDYLAEMLQIQIEPELTRYSFIYKEKITFVDVIKYARDDNSSKLASLLGLKSLVSKKDDDEKQYQSFINKSSKIEQLKGSFCFKNNDKENLVTREFLSEITRLGIINNQFINSDECFNIETESDFQFSRNGKSYQCDAFISISATNAVSEPFFFKVNAKGLSSVSYNNSKQVALDTAIQKLLI